MNTPVQIIERDGKPEWAVLPYDLYVQLTDDAEMLQDIRDYDSVKTAIEDDEEGIFPGEVTFALLDGENSVKVWRQYRGLTRQRLAEIVGISPLYLSQIEARRQTGTTEVLTAIARVLKVTLDDIVC